MTLNRNIGFGTTLLCDPTGGTDYVALANIITPPTGPSAKVEKVDITLLSEKWKSSSGAQGDPGEVSFGIQYDPADTNTTTVLTALLGNSNVASWKITYATGTATNAFSGWVTGFDRKTSLTERIEADVTIAVNGAPGV